MTHGQLVQALCALLLSLFISTLSSTVVSTGLPRIIGSLHGTQTAYTWVITATLLTATATMPIWGKLADLFSKKTLVQTATVVFVLGSIAAGISQSAGQLVAARAVQGVGMGGLQSLVQIAIGAMIPPRERGRYAGYQSSATALATIGGPLLGGLLVDTSWLGWRWCFFICIPIAVLALVMVQLTLRLPVIARADVRIDYLGATLIAAGVSLLLVWVSFVDSSFAWVSWQSGAMVGGAVVLLAWAAAVEARAAEPVVPLPILRLRPVALAIMGSLAAGTAMYGVSVFLSQYFQTARGHTPLQSGLLTAPMMAGILIASIIGGRLLSRLGQVKPFLLTGTTLLATGFAILATINDRTSLVLIGVAMVIAGAGIGLTIQNFVLLVQNSVALADIGAATATVTFFRSLGGTIGVAVLGAVLAHQVAHRTATGVPAPTAYGDATGHIFLISAGIAVLGIVAAAVLKPVSLRTSMDLPDNLKAAAAATEAAEGVAAADVVPESLDEAVNETTDEATQTAQAEAKA
jgi:EmrB/QacA subfamily drug resistance transporter